MDSPTKLSFTADLLRAVYNFSTSIEATELLALEDLRLVIAKAELRAQQPVKDPGHNPFDTDDF